MTTERRHKNNFLIVGIGASAGGVQPIKTLCSLLTKDCYAAYIIVHHFPPGKKSELTLLLSGICKLPVMNIKDNDTIMPYTIYVLEINENLAIANNKFKISKRKHGKNETINYFFSSLAVVAQHRAVAIVLSGAGSDGAEGCKQVIENGGSVIIQNPASAQHEGMPLNSIHHEHHEYILSPEDMPAAITRLQSQLQT
ncbi:MAG: chemotaxis protein CheB [Bacteroidia bacterium]